MEAINNGILNFQYIFVMPSSSARCAQFPRAQDKVHYYIQIKKLRDKLKGIESNDEIEETRYTFDLGKATGNFEIFLEFKIVI